MIQQKDRPVPFVKLRANEALELSTRQSAWFDDSNKDVFALLPLEQMESVLDENRKLKDQLRILSSPNVQRIIKQGENYKVEFDSYAQLIANYPELDVDNDS